MTLSLKIEVINKIVSMFYNNMFNILLQNLYFFPPEMQEC